MRTILVRLPRNDAVAYPEHITKAENLGLLYVGASLRSQGFDTSIVDADIEELSHDSLIERIVAHSPRAFGISVMDYSEIRRAIDLVHDVRTRLCEPLFIVVGGHAATYANANILSSGVIDCVVMYEGEQTIADLYKRIEAGEDWRGVNGISYFKDGKVETTPNQRRPDIERLPVALRDCLPSLLEKRKYVVSVVSSRGCHKNCIFCTNHDFHGPWRSRSPSKVVDELEYLHKVYGVSCVDFQDATFIGPGLAGQRRAFKIADEIIQRGLSLKFRISCTAETVHLPLFRRLSEAGLDGVNIGIESGVQTALDFFNKGTTVQQNIHALEILHKLELMHHSTIGFIMFHQNSSLEELQENIDFLKRYVVCVNPKCLTNRLTLPESILAIRDEDIYSEQAVNLKIARTGLSVVVAHLLRDYFSIFDAEDSVQSMLLEEWSNIVLSVAEHMVECLMHIDVTHVADVRVLLNDVNDMSIRGSENYQKIKHMTC